MLGFGLALMAIGGISGAAYLWSRFGYRIEAQPNTNATMTTDDQLVAGAPPASEMTDAQEGAGNTKEAIDAQEDSNQMNVAPDVRRNSFLDDPNGKGPGTDYVSGNDITGAASFLTMASGYLDDPNPEYDGPTVY